MSVSDPRSVWVPPAELTGHDSSAIPKDRVFFAKPPETIGRVVSAWSTLRAGKRRRPVGKCSLWAGSIAGVLVLLGEFAWVPLVSPRSADAVRLFVNILAAVVALIVFFAMFRFRAQCTFVGEDGIADFEIRGGDEVPTRSGSFRFQDAKDLRSSQTKNYYNGAYTGTSYDFTWSADSRVVYRLSGSYRSEAGTPKSDDPYLYARLAAAVWDAHLGNRLQAELEANGSLVFAVNSSDSVRVGQGWMEFQFAGRDPQRLTTADIESVKIAGGTFSIRTHDARWFSSKGKFSFQYGAMSNASLFLRALDVLMGYRFE